VATVLRHSTGVRDFEKELLIAVGEISHVTSEAMIEYVSVDDTQLSAFHNKTLTNEM
jgi:hypothetical protein